MTERGIENKIQELEMQLSTTVLAWSAGGSVDTGVLQGGKRGGRESGETEHSPPHPEPGDKQPSVLAPSHLTAKRHGDLPNLGAAGRTW